MRKFAIVIAVSILAGAWGRSDYEYMPGGYIASAGPPPSGAPFDTAVGVVAAFSTRKLLSAYAGSALRVRRTSDNTEQDIGFDGNGNLDQTALTTFVGANSGYVTIWYDQSGSARNISQATTTLQLRIVNAGTVETINGRASPRSPAGGEWYYRANGSVFLAGTTMDVYQIASSAATAYGRLLSMSSSNGNDWNNPGSILPLQLSGTTAQAVHDNTSTSALTYTSNAYTSFFTQKTATALTLTFTAGTGSVTHAATLALQNIHLSCSSTGSPQSFAGYRSEFVVTSANQTSPTTFIAEQKTYWGAS
jgi:hypothetical protein